MDIKTKALNQALNQLKVIGCNFKVITPDGQEFGDLEVVRPRVRTRRHNVFMGTGYRETIRNMQPGDVHVFVPPEGTTAQEFHKAISSCAGDTFGRIEKNHMAAVVGNTIELLCLGRDQGVLA